MADKTTFTTVTDGDKLFQGYFNGILANSMKIDDVVQDQTASTSTATSETKIGEVSLAADKVDHGVLVIATGSVYSNTGTASPGDVDLRIRAGTSSTVTSNAEIKAIKRIFDNTVGVNAGVNVGWCMTYYIDSLTWSSLNYIQVSAKTDTTNVTAECESLVVIPF